MPKIRYISKGFADKSLMVVAKAESILEEYQAQGYQLTLRQLYYQFVARGLLANTQAEYKRLGKIINDARLMGLIDWQSIIDRTRELEKVNHWESPEEIIWAAAQSFRIDKWASQTYRPEVWIEKDALVGVIEKTCESLDIPYLSCRGYISQSEMWAGAMRLAKYQQEGQSPIVFHLADHDPSGIDMTRDIQDRFDLFTGGEILVIRLGLNHDQVAHYSPPPNPTKITDSRANAYIAEYGLESWELDALEPQVINELISNAVANYRDEDPWRKALAEERHHIEQLKEAAREMSFD